MAALLLPTATLVVTDFARRGYLIRHLDFTHKAGYAGSVAVSAAVWAALLYVACWRRSKVRHVGAVLFVAAYGLAIGVQGAFFALYRLYSSLDSQVDADSFAWSILGTLPISEARVWVRIALGLAVAGLLLGFARTVVRPRWLPKLIRPVFIVAAVATLIFMPVSYRKWQSTSPDLIYFHGLVAEVRDRMKSGNARLVRAQRRRPEAVPALTPSTPFPRNVLFILQESQRFDVTCTEYRPTCDLATPESNRVTPLRLPLLQMRSNASSTHLSMQVLWSGLAPNADKKAMETAPLVWGYARAAGYDIAYWTSQNLVFGNERMAVQGIPFSHQVNGTELDPHADIIAGAPDRLLTDRVIAEIGQLREPWYAVVHYANIHRPRIFDAKKAPFQPTEDADHRKKTPEQKNFYKNAVYLSDVAVGRLIEHLKGTDSGKRTVIFYTSDHGEGYFEHHQDNDHAGSVFEEEIHVPTWIDAPPNTLSPEETASLREKRRAYVFHVDVAPTLLDLLGVWDAPELEPFKKAMMGHPLSRRAITTDPVPLSNVSWVWEYVVPNWGMMQGSLKVEALEKDTAWHCYDVASDPAEKRELAMTTPRCAQLGDVATKAFHMLPKDMGHLRTRPDWGQQPGAEP